MIFDISLVTHVDSVLQFCQSKYTEQHRNLTVNSLSSFFGTLIFSRTSGQHQYFVSETDRTVFPLNSGKA